MTTWDALVIGGGCNGLAAAAMMAKHGHRTLLLEQRPVVGGLSGTFEYQPGHQIHGMRPFAGGSRLDWLKPLGITLADLPRNRTNESWIIRDSHGQNIDPASASGYVQFRAYLGRIAPVLRQIFGCTARPYTPGRGVRTLGALIRSGLSAAPTLARTAPLSAQDFLDEFFTSDIVKGALAAPMLLRTMGGPWTPFGALQLMLHESSGDGFAGAELARVLRAAAQMAGVTIQTGCQAVSIQSAKEHLSVSLSNGSCVTAHSIIAACSLKLLFDSLIDPALTTVQPQFRARGTCAVLAISSGAWPSSLRPAQIRCALGMTKMERAFDCIKHGQIPNQQVLAVSAPKPEATGHAVRIHALQTPPLPAKSWTPQARRTLEQRILAQLRDHVPELTGEIVHTHLWTPADLEQEFMVPGGHLWHFDRDLDQLTHPPSPSAPQGVYWGKAHMESGFVCAPGIQAARTALRGRNRP